MKINKLQINSFGKLKDKKIEFKQGINLIYGENEAGKSSMLKYILASFYGVSKTKNGKEISDYERYKPWNSEEFSGKLEYQLDNGNVFEIFRDFNKKNPKIYNENLEDVSNQYNIDKTKGSKFFAEQTKVDENLFVSSILVNQNEVKLDKGQSNILIQKISNTFSSGEGNISYKKAIDKIAKRQLEEVGNSRTREKPINVVDSKIKEIEKQIKELENSKEAEKKIEESVESSLKEINLLNSELNMIKEIKKIKETRLLSQEKNKIKSNIKQNNEKSLNELENKLENINNQVEENDKNEFELKRILNNKIKRYYNEKIISTILLIALILANICQYFLIENLIIKNMILASIPIYLIICIIKLVINRKNKKKQQKDIEEIETKINNLEKDNKSVEEQISIIRQNIKLVDEEIEKENIQCDFEVDLIKRRIWDTTRKESADIVLKFIDDYEEKQIEEINQIKEELQEDINEKKIKLHTLETDKTYIDKNIEKYVNSEEDLSIQKQKYKELQELNNSMEIAKNTINEVYQKMKNGITPKLVENLSENISKITNNKYTNVHYDDEDGILVELENGDYINAQRLSVGTIDQLYLSLRFALINELSDEKMPIILDEAFAYYDTQRLENILKYLNENYADRQIIIFTCTKREIEVLEKEKIDFNCIEL